MQAGVYHSSLARFVRLGIAVMSKQRLAKRQSEIGN
jgi:hypothetical protein